MVEISPNTKTGGGSHKKPLAGAAAEKAARKLDNERIQAWIDYRFIKEVERMEREGRIINRLWLADQMGVTRHLFARIRSGEMHASATHIRKLKDLFNADYQFILFGVANPDLSLPVRNINGQRTRIDVYEKYVFAYKNEPKWSPLLPPRREGDEEQMFEAAYYLDRKSTSEI